MMAQAASMAMEWAAVAPGRVVVATADNTWIHTPVFSGQPDVFALPMTAPGTLVTTRRLLDGAIAAASRDAPASPGPRPPLTALRWAWRLAGYYCTTHATPRLMARAAERFESQGRAQLAAWARDKVREETGHDTLALRDLAAMGFDAERVVATVQPETALALVRYFEARVLEDDDPVGCVGYAYALERLALERGPADVDAVDALMPAGVTATRCLRVHSATGSDAAHVDEAAGLVTALSASERAAVARACYQSAEIYFTPPADGFLSEDALQAQLTPLKQLSQ